jgi:hypothetical protein
MRWTVRRRSMRRSRAEAILDGRADPNDPVARVVGAAQAAEEDEPAGLDAAVAAFTSAGIATGAASAGDTISAPTPPRGAALRTVLAGSAVRKIIAVVVAALVAAAGAVAVVAIVGHRSGPGPAPSTSASHSATASSVPPRSSPAPSSPAGRRSSTAGPPGGTASRPAPAALRDLCRTWLAGPSARIHSPKFRVLIDVAGGVSRVAPYCHSLLNALPGSGANLPSPSRVRPSTPRVSVTPPRLPTTSITVRQPTPAPP